MGWALQCLAGLYNRARRRLSMHMPAGCRCARTIENREIRLLPGRPWIRLVSTRPRGVSPGRSMIALRRCAPHSRRATLASAGRHLPRASLQVSELLAQAFAVASSVSGGKAHGLVPRHAPRDRVAAARHQHRSRRRICRLRPTCLWHMKNNHVMRGQRVNPASKRSVTSLANRHPIHSPEEPHHVENSLRSDRWYLRRHR